MIQHCAIILAISTALASGHASEDEYLGFDGSASLGTLAGPVSEQAQERSGGDGSVGVEVIGVWSGSAGDLIGLERGDIIVAINGGSIASLEDLRNEVALAGNGGAVEVVVQRGGKTMELHGQLGPWPAGKTRVPADVRVEQRFRAWQQRRLEAMERMVQEMQRVVEDLERGQPVQLAPYSASPFRSPVSQALAELPPWRLRVHLSLRRGHTRASQAEPVWDARVLLGSPAPEIR